MAIFGHTKFIPVLLGNIVKKNWNIHFWPFLIYTSLFGKNCWKKNLEHPFLAIPNLYQSFWEKLSEKIWNGHFLAMPNLYQSSWEKLPEKNWNNHIWPFLIYTSLLGKICWKKFRMAIPNLYQSSWEKLLEINMEWPFLPFQILYQSFWEKLSEKDWNNHIWPFQIYTSPSGKHCWKKIGTNIFGHS